MVFSLAGDARRASAFLEPPERQISFCGQPMTWSGVSPPSAGLVGGRPRASAGASSFGFAAEKL